MKTALALAAAIGLSVSTAAATCPGHVSASADKDTVVASIVTGSIPAPADAAKQEKAE